MERNKIEIEKAWEQALGDIFHPYMGPGEKPARPSPDAFRASSYEIRRHMAKTAARQGSTALHQYLADEYWGKRR
ncbi:hypothetical protein [Sphingobium mellinum]|uniref:hypothetical protein n=1 Tax=Sphingobium mellinum TaxID=1387166 RepID=UPI0030EE9358